MNSKDQTKGISFFEQCRGLLSRSLEYDPRIPFIFRLNPQRKKPPSLRHSVCLFSLRKLRRPTWCHLGEPNFVPTSPLNPALLLPTTDISNRYSISVGRNYSAKVCSVSHWYFISHFKDIQELKLKINTKYEKPIFFFFYKDKRELIDVFITMEKE